MIMIVVTMKKITTMIIMMVAEAFLEMVEMAMAMIMAKKKKYEKYIYRCLGNLLCFGKKANLYINVIKIVDIQSF